MMPIEQNCDTQAFETDRYGGNMAITREATGFFRTEKVNGRWLLITPEGHGYVALGANHTGYMPASKKNGFWEEHRDDIDRGAEILLEKLKEFGLNAGSSFEHEPRHAHALPRVARLYYAPGEDRLGPAGYGPDVFDDAALAKLRAFIIERVKPYANDPWVIGISASNIPPWDDRRMQRVRASEPNAPMRRKYQEFIQGRYADITAYNRVYEDQLSSFDPLASAEALKPFPQNKNTRADNDAFMALIADRLYAATRSAIREGAPNHLFLGESVTFRNLPDPVLKAIGPHIDAYSGQVIEFSWGARIIEDVPGQAENWRVFNKVAFDHVHALTGKPIIVDDWVASFSLGETYDTGTECGVFYDEKRATEEAAEWLMTAFKQPHLIGVFMCTPIGTHAADRLLGGTSRRSYFRDDGTPFPVRTDMMKKANREALQAAYAPALPHKK